MAAQRQELTVVPFQNVSFWDDEFALKEIKNIFAPELSILEFKVFTAIGKATGLNPYLREIWAVKYDGQKAQIFIGRDGYRKSAQRSPHYDYHLSDAVYENDEFDVESGEVKHKYSLKNRGNLLGAYCTVKRKGASKANFVFVELKEYDKHQSTWKSLKTTMIKKVAEAQALRASFQEIFAGTYHEYEQAEIIDVVPAPKPAKGMDALEEMLGIEETVINENEVVISELMQLLIDKNVPQKSREKWCKQFDVNVVDDIPIDGMKAIIKHLKKEKK